MFFHLAQRAVQYEALKARLFKNTGIISVLMGLILVFTMPQQLLFLWAGTLMAYGYLFALSFQAEFPQRRLAVALSIIRMATVSFLIVWVGQFKLLETCIVFCGFLSYKIVLVLEFVRHSVGIQFHRGK